MRQKLINLLTNQYYRLSKQAAIGEAKLEKSGQKKLKTAGQVLFARFQQNLLEFLIIVLADSSRSFQILKKRDELAVCQVSYVEYRLYSKKLKLLSLGGLSSVIMATLMISLVVNFVMPNWRALAATFNWQQTNWAGGLDAGAYPNHTDNRDSWTNYSEKTITVDTTQANKVMPTDAIINVGTTDADFTGGANLRTVIENDSVVLDLLE